MKEKHRFYVLGHGWATKYYWFNVLEEVTPKTPDFVEMIKKEKFTFSKQSGTTPADAHGSTLALHFYSGNFIKLLKKERKSNFFTHKISFVLTLQKIGSYYYIEPKTYPVKCFDKNDMNSYLKKYPFAKLSLYKSMSDTLIAERTLYDLSDWNNQMLFGVWNSTRNMETYLIVITAELKKIIEKAKLKNVTFEELIPYNIRGANK